MTSKLSDTLVIPTLTGIQTAIAMYGAYGNYDVYGLNGPLVNGVGTGLASLITETTTNYGLDKAVYDSNAPYVQKAKMAIEPALVGLTNYGIAKMSNTKTSAIGCFAIGSGANVLAAYENSIIYKK